MQYFFFIFKVPNFCSDEISEYRISYYYLFWKFFSTSVQISLKNYGNIYKFPYLLFIGLNLKAASGSYMKKLTLAGKLPSLLRTSCCVSTWLSTHRLNSNNVWPFLFRRVGLIMLKRGRLPSPYISNLSSLFCFKALGMFSRVASK